MRNSAVRPAGSQHGGACRCDTSKLNASSFNGHYLVIGSNFNYCRTEDIWLTAYALVCCRLILLPRAMLVKVYVAFSVSRLHCIPLDKIPTTREQSETNATFTQFHNLTLGKGCFIVGQLYINI